MKLHTFSLLCIALIAAEASTAGPLEDAASRITALNQLVQGQSERITRLEAQLQNQGLLGLLNQVETLKSDVARLRGAQEEQAYRLENSDKRSKDLFLDIDERLKELISRPAETSIDAIRLQPSQSLVVTPMAAKLDVESEMADYEIAHGLIKAGKYKEAIIAFQKFVYQYPSGSLAANAVYWIGISQITGMSDFRAAADSYQRLLKDYPSSPKVPDALLSLARAQIQLEEKDLAKDTLNRLMTRYSTSKAAENGKKLLATLN